MSPAERTRSAPEGAAPGAGLLAGARRASRAELRTGMVDRPGAIVRLLFRRLFAAIRFDEAEVARLRAAAARGPVVYVLRTVSWLEYLYFNHALAAHDLPLARFANGPVQTVLLWPLRIVVRLLVTLWRLARRAPAEDDEEEVMVRHLEQGEAVVLFLRGRRRGPRGRRPSRLLRAAATLPLFDPGEDRRVRGRFMEHLLGLQRRLGARRSLQLAPMTLLWGRPLVRPAGTGALDALFGEPEAPGRLRALWMFVRHHRSSLVKVAEPLDLGEFLAANAERSEDALARTLRFELSGRIERERRAILGPPLKNARRVRLEVLRSRRLAEALDRLAAQPGAPPRAALVARADRHLRAIAAAPARWALTFLRQLLRLVFARIYEGIDVDPASLAAVRAAAKQGPLILLPTHRSHVDYLVLSYVFVDSDLPPPHIAAGANLSFFPAGTLFRRAGAFFLRRTFRGDELYGAVFAAYVRRLLRDGFNLEFFIEGTRSRSGKLLPPRLGLLGIVADAALDGDAPEARLVPVAITYEKVVEERSYVEELRGGEKPREDLGALLRVRRVLRSKYGRIDLRFGEPFTLGGALAEAGAAPGCTPEERRAAVRRLGHRIAWSIAQAVAVTPSALLAASCLTSTTRAIPRRELDRRVGWLAALARAGGASFATALESDFASSLRRALDLLANDGDLELRGEGDDELVVVPEERRSHLEYYKNNAIHTWADASIVARAVLAAGGDAGRDRVRDLAATASRLLKQELTFRPGGGLDAAFGAVTARLRGAGWLRLEADRIVATPAGGEPLRALAGLTASYLDSYRLVVRASLAHPRLGRRELAGRAAALGERALLLGELGRREAISRPIFEGAARFLEDAGALGDAAALERLLRDLDAVA